MKPQLSLFENKTCTQCDKPIKKGLAYCVKCEKSWKEKYIKINLQGSKL